MELTSITQEIYTSSKRLNDGSKELFNLAKKKAETERAYRKALAIEIMDLKDKKYPATLISDLARGNTSELKFERDLADTVWTSARESLKALESQQSGLQTILKHQTEI